MQEELCTDQQSANSAKHEPKLTVTITVESVHSNCLTVIRIYTLHCCHKHFETFFHLGIEYQISGSHSGVNEESISTGSGGHVCQCIVTEVLKDYSFSIFSIVQESILLHCYAV
jgi:hypothetical protein